MAFLWPGFLFLLLLLPTWSARTYGGSGVGARPVCATRAFR